MIAYWQGQNVGQLAEAVEDKGYDSKSNVCPQDAKGGNADEVAKELLLFYGQACVENDGG